MARMILLSDGVKQCIADWVQRGYPRETCGLLLGTTEGPSCRVALAREARNVVETRMHDRFELDPAALLEADAEAQRLGLDIVGVWHSHPDHPARPSETDREMAWPGWSYLIVSVGAQGVADWRSWRLHCGAFEEEVIEQ